MYTYNHKVYKNLSDIIQISDNSIISFVGGGGKTTSIMQLSAYLNSQNKSHIIMTTTNMLVPQCKVYNDVVLIKSQLTKNAGIWVGEKIKKNSIDKLKEPSKEVMDYIFNNLDIPILIEADGSKCLPIKINREYEPVIPLKSNIVISVVGIDAMKDKIKYVAHRADVVSTFVGKKIDDFLDEFDLAKIITSDIGLSKGVQSYMQHYILINKCDSKYDEELAIKVKNLIKKEVIYGSILNIN